MPGSNRTRGVDSARRVLQILLQFSDDKPEMTVDEVAQLLSISVPSAYRYIALLRELYLVEERNRGTYVLSPQILQLAVAAESTLDLSRVARPILERIMRETGDSALVVRRIREAAVCVAIAKPEHAMRLSFMPGHIMPLHGGAAPKLLLSEFSDPKLRAYLERADLGLSAKDRKRILTDIAHIRETDYSESSGEVDVGVWATAAAIRVSKTLLGAVSIVAPSYRISEDDKEARRQMVRQAGAEIAAAVTASGT